MHYFVYQEYFWNLTIISLILCLVSIYVMITSIISFAKKMILVSNSEMTYFKRLSGLLPTTIFLIISIILISISMHNLKYGKELFFEKEDDAMTQVGRVSAIKLDDLSPRFYDQERKIIRASIVTIDNKDYYFMTADGISLGDVLRITYLPKSTIVLNYQNVLELGPPDVDSPLIENNNQKLSSIRDSIFLICFIALFIFLSIRSRMKRYELPSKHKNKEDKDWVKNEVRRSKYEYKKWGGVILLINIFLLLLVIFTKNLSAVFIMVVFTGISSGYMYLSKRNDYFTYDESGITVYTITGKPFFIEYTRIFAIEDTDIFSDRTWQRGVVIQYDKTTLTYSDNVYVGINRFLEYVKSNGVCVTVNRRK